MKILIKLCKSVFLKNKGFSICILLMSILTASIGFLGANFGISSKDTIDKFIKDNVTFDAVYYVDYVNNDDLKKIEDIDGIKNISKRFIYDIKIETKQGNIYPVRLFKQESFFINKYTIHAQIEYDSDLPKLYLSKEFADYNNLNAGDHLFINTIEGKKEAIIKAIISNAETISCVKDQMSSYEEYQFAYLYIDEDDFFKLTNKSDISNQLLIYFEEDKDIDEKKEYMEEIRLILDDHLISETLMIESEEFNTINDDINTIGIICRFVPTIIWLISLGFDFIFIKIIVENQRKTIGLLRALGFSIKKVISIFVLYTVIINIPALIVGTYIGYKILDICLSVISSSYGIIDTVITILPFDTIVSLLIIFIIGIISALMSSKTISKIDPSDAYSEIVISEVKPPLCFLKLNIDSFVKISLMSIIRNYKRQIIGSLCITACIISMCVGLEGVMSIGYPIEAVYGGRYKYDLIVRNIDQKTIDRINEEIDGVLISEPSIIFMAEMLDKDVRLSTINENDELTVLENAKGEKIYPDNGIIIDEMCAKINNIKIGDEIKINDCYFRVDEIAREILYNVIYINEDSAHKLGYEEKNCLSLKAEDLNILYKIEDEITKINENAYFVRFDLQKENIKDSLMAMRIVMFVFAILAFFIGSLLVFNITIIDFNDNKMKFSIFRAIGVGAKRLCIVCFIQNIFRVIVGIIVAIPLSYICNYYLLELLSNASQQYIMINYNMCFIISCLMTLFYVLFGMIISLYKINKIDFSKEMNGME